MTNNEKQKIIDTALVRERALWYKRRGIAKSPASAAIEVEYYGERGIGEVDYWETKLVGASALKTDNIRDAVANVYGGYDRELNTEEALLIALYSTNLAVNSIIEQAGRNDKAKAVFVIVDSANFGVRRGTALDSAVASAQFNISNEHYSKDEIASFVKYVYREQEAQSQEQIVIENKSLIEKCNTDEVHFYTNDYNHSVERIYYNPDSNAGGQFVSDTLTLEQLSNGIKDCKDLEEFWDYWSANADQYCDDIDTHEFTEKVVEFASPDCDFKGETKETLEKLKEWVAEQQTALEQPQNIDMG